MIVFVYFCHRAEILSSKNLTGTRMNVLFSSLGALIFALIVAFMAGWKLTFVVLCFTPLLILSGYLQGRTQSKAGQSKTAKSFAEEGGRVSCSNFLDLRNYFTKIVCRRSN